MRRLVGLGLVMVLGTSASAQGTVVTYPLSAKAPRIWTVASKPLVEIGGVDGVGPTLFSRIQGAGRTSDGHVVIADYKTAQLRLFDSTGRFVNNLSRQGRGPNEFIGINFMSVVGELIAVSTPMRELMIARSPGATFINHRQQSTPGFFTYGAPFLVDDSTVVLRLRKGVWEKMETHQRDSLWIARYNLRDSTFKVLGAQPEAPLFGKPGGTPIYRFGFSAEPQITTAGQRYCLADGAQYEVSCYDLAGRPHFRVRRDVQRVRVTAGARKAFRDAEAGIGPNGKSRYEGSLAAHRKAVAEAAKFATEFPAFARIQLATSGELWIKPYDVEDGLSSRSNLGSPRPTTWSIFGRDGKWIADCTLPAHFRPTDIGADYVLGISYDEDDVERVTVLHLRRGP